MRWDLLLLLFAANATPALVGRIAGDRWNAPLDFGACWRDGERLFGSHKTWRGLIASVLACSLVAAAFGFSAGIGAAFGLLAMLGDAISAFVKRRLRLAPGREAFLLDQLPETLLPSLLLQPALGVSLTELTVAIPLFVVLAMLGARALDRIGPVAHTGPALASLLLAVYSVIWFALAIAPRYREDWLLENVLVLLALPWLIHKYRRAPFTDLAYLGLFLFFVLHALGAHYTYSEVPYDQWWRSAFGHSLNELVGWQRNHFDRFVHFGYGLLIGPAAFELIAQASAPRRDLWRWLLPWTFLLAHSAIYELMEWLAALVFGGDLGMAFLGTQGDEWDAQKDTALCATGAMISVVAAFHLARRREARSSGTS